MQLTVVKYYDRTNHNSQSLVTHKRVTGSAAIVPSPAKERQFSASPAFTHRKISMTY